MSLGWGQGFVAWGVSLGSGLDSDQSLGYRLGQGRVRARAKARGKVAVGTGRLLIDKLSDLMSTSVLSLCR